MERGFIRLVEEAKSYTVPDSFKQTAPTPCFTFSPPRFLCLFILPYSYFCVCAHKLLKILKRYFIHHLVKKICKTFYPIQITIELQPPALIGIKGKVALGYNDKTFSNN